MISIPLDIFLIAAAFTDDMIYISEMKVKVKVKETIAVAQPVFAWAVYESKRVIYSPGLHTRAEP